MLKLLIMFMCPLMIYLNKFSWLMNIWMILLVMMMYVYMYMSWGILSLKLNEWLMLDSLSFLLVILTMWMCIMMFICSWKIMMLKYYFYNFFILILALMLILMMSFMQSNILCFYILFEFSLLPTMILIMKWGYQPERLQASVYLMLYTVMGSLPMLVCLFHMINLNMNFNMFTWFMFKSNNFIENWWFILLLGFLVKIPMYPFHLWLPKAHVEAPVAGSVILASILLKLGGYGVMRMINLFPWLNLKIIPIVLSLSLMGGFSTSMICLRQVDLKSLVAYSSVSHMGLMLVGLCSSCSIGISGSLMMMVAHAFSSSALFILANLTYDSCNSRSLMTVKGLILFMPWLSMLWFFFSIMNMAAPPFLNIFSEIMILFSLFIINKYSVILFGFISFTTLCYSLNMYSMVNHGSWSMYFNSYKLISMKDYMNLMFMLLSSVMLIMKLSMFNI
uniref:NADH dehydrogenase subunit 4 n=1 Tax=Poecilobdella javanica TaxID=1348077 RepID=UPI001F13CC2F|nr:NADH dehydrogenase subunit 4 [Poecilobdella javanica]ULO25931.1 NADH dehydrogenase subunit 4 [Poecilobdella javanica]